MTVIVITSAKAYAHDPISFIYSSSHAVLLELSISILALNALPLALNFIFFKNKNETKSSVLFKKKINIKAIALMLLSFFILFTILFLKVISITKFDINSNTGLSFSTNKLISSAFSTADFFNVPEYLYLEDSSSLLNTAMEITLRLFFFDGVSLWLL